MESRQICFFKSFKCREEPCSVLPTVSEYWSLLEGFRRASLRHNSRNECFMESQINVIYLSLSPDFGEDPINPYRTNVENRVSS